MIVELPSNEIQLNLIQTIKFIQIYSKYSNLLLSYFKFITNLFRIYSNYLQNYLQNYFEIISKYPD